jgi:osmotically inducible protein OsmC
MATTRTATTTWDGGLTDGKGQVVLESSGVGSFDVSWPARAEEPNGVTSPEELIAAAHSACFSMALSAALGKAGTPPQRLETHAEVDFQPGTGITQIRLSVRGTVDGIEAAAFKEAAEGAKQNCPVSKALAGVEITLDATTLA